MGFRSLRVINEDIVAPGGGFSPHSHRDMEILTYVLEGALEHKDSMGNGSIVRPGEVQRMSAGTGVSHSEYNHSNTEPVHFMQIWIVPERTGLPPGYEQRAFAREAMRGTWLLIAGRHGRNRAVTIHQDVRLFVTRLVAGDEIPYRLEPGRHAWTQVVCGRGLLNGLPLAAGDGAEISLEERLEFRADNESEILLFDLA